MSHDADTDYDCSWTRKGVAALVVSRGAMRGPEAFDRYLIVINEALEDPEVFAIISDVRLATRLPTVRSACVMEGAIAWASAAPAHTPVPPP